MLLGKKIEDFVVVLQRGSSSSIQVLRLSVQEGASSCIFDQYWSHLPSLCGGKAREDWKADWRFCGMVQVYYHLVALSVAVLISLCAKKLWRVTFVVLSKYIIPPWTCWYKFFSKNRTGKRAKTVEDNKCWQVGLEKRIWIWYQCDENAERKRHYVSLHYYWWRSSQAGFAICD